MNRRISTAPASVVEKISAVLEHYLHVEAVGGVILLAAAACALFWANSPWRGDYEALWHTPLSIGVGTLSFSQSLHFWINDGLMTIFFLVVGLEIRREMHEGALSTLRQASLPLIAAIGGVIAPALIYLAFNAAATRQGWAVPTATDIAFAVGVLALLGKRIPASLRILLLALAIIDDIVAILVIALFYSSGISLAGLSIALLGVLGVFLFQRLGVKSAVLYVLPGAIVWIGLLRAGVHPTLAGVILGMITPVTPLIGREDPLRLLAGATEQFDTNRRAQPGDTRELMHPLRQLDRARLEVLSPVVRVQATLHPWVAFCIMPLFALANAGVSFAGLGFEVATSVAVGLGVTLGLVVGKPLGIVLATWLAVRAGVCELPPGLDMKGILLVGCLGGIGFTMAIFIANLAFADAALLAAAKLSVLAASAVAGAIGLTVGAIGFRQAAVR